MDDGKQRKARDSIWWEIRPFVYLAGLLACAVAVGYFARYVEQAHEWPEDLFLLVIGCLLLALSVSQFRSGVANTGYGDHRRSEDPFEFWLAILFQFVFGAGAVVAALGDMFGLWQW